MSVCYLGGCRVGPRAHEHCDDCGYDACCHVSVDYEVRPTLVDFTVVPLVIDLEHGAPAVQPRGEEDVEPL